MVRITATSRRIIALACIWATLGHAPTAQQPDPSVSSATERRPRTPVPDSPRGAFQAFRAHAHSARWNDAASLLELDDSTSPRAVELARRLNAVLESLYEFDPETLSGSSTGRLDDGLPPDIEEIAVVQRDGDEPVRLVRLTEADATVWRFTASTVSRVDGWYDGLQSRWLRDRLSESRFKALLREGPLDLFYWQWLAFLLIAVTSVTVGWLLHRTLRRLMFGLTKRTQSPWDDRFVDSVGPPFVLASGALLFAVLSVFTDLNRESVWIVRLVVRPALTAAFYWALWRASAVAVAWAMGRRWAVNSASARNLLAIGTNISKAIIIALGVVSVVAALGFPVGTVVAGLGIGGVALAFGAQKTVENLFGSVALALDQPIRVGDFVKVQDFVGTVEDIGIRSTRIRTLDRTLISIPNGKLTEERLESFEVRDRMRLFSSFGLSYDTTQPQMRSIIAAVEAVLRAHPRIWPGAIAVHFVGLGASSLDVEVTAWFAVPTWNEFQECRQQILLAIMEIIKREGATFAFPTRTVHLVTDQASTAELRMVATTDGSPVDTDAATSNRQR
jgi:MscS family membrane protein